MQKIVGYEKHKIASFFRTYQKQVIKTGSPLYMSVFRKLFFEEPVFITCFCFKMRPQRPRSGDNKNASRKHLKRALVRDVKCHFILKIMKNTNYFSHS